MSGVAIILRDGTRRAVMGRGHVWCRMRGTDANYFILVSYIPCRGARRRRSRRTVVQARERGLFYCSLDVWHVQWCHWMHRKRILVCACPGAQHTRNTPQHIVIMLEPGPSSTWGLPYGKNANAISESTQNSHDLRMQLSSPRRHTRTCTRSEHWQRLWH